MLCSPYISTLRHVDTIFVFHNNAPEVSSYLVKSYCEPLYIINPGRKSEYMLNMFYMSWEEYFSELSLHGLDTTYVYAFNANKIDKKSDDVEAAFLGRYNITLPDMIRVNWHLTYPPDSILSVNVNQDPDKDPETKEIPA